MKNHEEMISSQLNIENIIVEKMGLTDMKGPKIGKDKQETKGNSTEKRIEILGDTSMMIKQDAQTATEANIRNRKVTTNK